MRITSPCGFYTRYHWIVTLKKGYPVLNAMKIWIGVERAGCQPKIQSASHRARVAEREPRREKSHTLFYETFLQLEPLLSLIDDPL